MKFISERRSTAAPMVLFLIGLLVLLPLGASLCGNRGSHVLVEAVRYKRFAAAAGQSPAQASALCIADGGNLASIPDAAAWTTMKSDLSWSSNSFPFPHFYSVMGAHRVAGKIWKWDLGPVAGRSTVFYDVNTVTCQTYCNWLLGQPDGGGGDYLVMDTNGQWSDVDGSSSPHQQYICEYGSVPCTSVADCNNRATSVSGDSHSGCTCTCGAKWSGNACQTCAAKYNQATCASCASGYESFDNCYRICTDATDCSSNGTASGNANTGCNCTCRNQWSGSTCNTCNSKFSGSADCDACSSTRDQSTYPNCYLKCTNSTNCNNRATMVTGNTNGGCRCTCDTQWTGAACDLTAMHTETHTETHTERHTGSITASHEKTHSATLVLPVASHTLTVPLPLPVAAPLYSKAECALRPVHATLVDFAGIQLDAANSTWVQQVAAVDVRDSGFSFSFKLLSCHEFSNSASQKLFTLVGTATGAQSMASLAAGPYQFVQQKVSDLGKVVTVKVGPLSIYSPRTVDSLTFVWNKDMFRVPLASDSLVASAGSRRQQNTSSAKNYKVSVVSRTVGLNPTVGTVSSGGAAVGGAVSVFGGPGMAAAANRQALLTNVANCPQLLSDESLHWSHNPTGLTIGVSIFRYHLGTLLGNSIIAIGILFIHFLIGIIVKLWVGCTMVDAVGHVRLPARSLPAVTFLMQPTLTSAFIVASYSDDVQHIVSCAFISVISLVVVLSTGWILVMWKPPRFDVKFWKKPHDPTRTCLSKATYCTGHYIPADLNRMHFIRILGAIFEDYNPDVRYFFFVDLLVMGVSAYLMAIFPDSATDCEWTFIGALVIFGTYTLVCFVTWPFTALVLNLVFTFTAFSQFLSALFMFFAFSQNDDNLMLWSEIFNLIGLGLQLFNLLYDVLMGIFELATRDDQNTKVTRIATALEKAKIHRSDAVLTRGFSSCFSRHQVSETIEYVYLRDSEKKED